ncbi:MAG: FAD-binding oxidoreductase, partial [Deltaproteobacteria bacterium]
MGLDIRTSGGSTAVLDNIAVDRLRAGFAGQLVGPDSPDYDQARQVWNAMISRRPALIARCAGAGDVAAAVRFAREHGLLVSVRGAGHNIAGNAVCDGGLVIDLSTMRSVAVDPTARTARVGAGATLGDFDRAAQAHGLATPLGINSTTGIAGLTLGGGFGWLSRKYGLTIDNLLSADVVTAAGDPVRASPKENSDLFWGIRGGGGNFGVVTSFEFGLHPVGPEVLCGLVVHPLKAARDVLRQSRDLLTTSSDELVCWFVMRKAPPLPFLPEKWHGREILAMALCHAGSVEEGTRAAAPLRALGRPIADVVGPQPYAGWQTAFDPLLTPGMRNYWKSHDLREVSDGLIEVLVGAAERLPDPQCEVFLGQLGGAVSRIAPEATAYTHRDAEFVMNIHARWADPAMDAACIGWARKLFQAAAPFATGGVYVNFMTQDESERVQAAYGANYARLAQLKSRYDPT